MWQLPHGNVFIYTGLLSSKVLADINELLRTFCSVLADFFSTVASVSEIYLGLSLTQAKCLLQKHENVCCVSIPHLYKTDNY